jgi:hypothetical protein
MTAKIALLVIIRNIQRTTNVINVSLANTVIKWNKKIAKTVKLVPVELTFIRTIPRDVLFVHFAGRVFTTMNQVKRSAKVVALANSVLVLNKRLKRMRVKVVKPESTVIVLEIQFAKIVSWVDTALN